MLDYNFVGILIFVQKLFQMGDSLLGDIIFAECLYRLNIEVHNNDKYDGHCHVKVDIYFTAIGMFSMPTEEELQEQMEQYADKKNA